MYLQKRMGFIFLTIPTSTSPRCVEVFLKTPNSPVHVPVQRTDFCPGSIVRSLSTACFALLRAPSLSVPLSNSADLLLCPAPPHSPALVPGPPSCRMLALLITQVSQAWPQPSGCSQMGRISTCNLETNHWDYL